MYVRGAYVAALLCYLHSFVEKISSLRFSTLPVRLGVGWHAGLQFGCMGSKQTEGVRINVAKLIEFYVPEHFRPRVSNPPEEQRGRVIEFRPREKDANKTVNYESLPGSVQRSAVPE